MQYIPIKLEMMEKILDVEYELFRDIDDMLTLKQRRKLGLELHRFDDYPAVKATNFHARFCNKVIGDYDDSLIEWLGEIEDWYCQSIPFATLSILPNPRYLPIIHQLTDYGYLLGGFDNYWLLKLDGTKFALDDHIQVVSEELKDTLVEVSSYAFDMSNVNTANDALSVIVGVIPRHSQGFLYYEGVTPVGTGMINIAGDFSYLYNDSVIPDHRGFRIQQKMILHRLEYARQQGARYAAVVTDFNSTSGRNMQRLGFQLAFTLLHYEKRFDEEMK